MNYTITPLAVSAHAPTMQGALYCFSLHNKAVNLTNQKNQMITLHRYNSGLSPMGWLLKSHDFDKIYDLIAQGASLWQQENGNLIIGNCCLMQNYRRLSLDCNHQSEINFSFVKERLKSINAKTGLFGPLNENLTENLPSELKNFIHQFILLLTHKSYDFSPYIGRGPGLTPSYDDMIIGIFAVLHSDLRLKTQLQFPSIDLPISKLELLTSKVSATFLSYAIQGFFTSSLLAVIYLIRQYKINSLAIDKLIGYGHTSGADLLLGIWLGAVILEKLSL